MRKRFRAKHWLIMSVGTVAIVAAAVIAGFLVYALWFWIIEPLLVVVLWGMLLSEVNETARMDYRLDRYLGRW